MNVSRIKGLSYGMAATVLWSCAYPVSRYMFKNPAEEPDGIAASFMFIVIAAIMLSPTLFNRKSWQLLLGRWKTDLPLLLILAAAGAIGEGTLVFISTKYTTASRASLMANCAPIFTVILSICLAKEKLTWQKAIGAAVGFVGLCAAMYSQGGDIFSGSASTRIGDLLAVASGICWAVYTVLGDGPTERYGAPFCTGFVFCLGTVLMIPLLFCFDCRIDLHMPLGSWIGIVYQGAINRALAYALWFAALHHIRPGELGAFGYLTPLLAGVLSIVLFKEHAGMLFIAAFVLILGGVGLMTTSLKKTREDRLAQAGETTK